MTAIVDPPVRPGLARRATSTIVSSVIGTLLCLHPVLSIMALGWLSRRMSARIDQNWAIIGSEAPGWLLGDRGRGVVTRLLGGLASNIYHGVQTLVALGIYTLPFTAIWTVSWWAGWNNSFTKGYEQAFIGPILGLGALALSLPLLGLLPIALAHFAAERRVGAILELRHVFGVAVNAGWRLVVLSMATALYVGPLLLSRTIPVFIEDIVPGFATMATDAQQNVANVLNLATAAWAFIGLWWLRTRAAAIYAVAAPAAASLRPALWNGARAAEQKFEARQKWRVGILLRLTLVVATTLAIPVSIYIGQFMNHSWINWLTNPVFLLPWMP